ncbi:MULTISPECIES: serine hydrolase [Flavobacterium]|uniref:Serine hydrolase n=1 Tax=Flavobacterium keumense TaxID=1306518 RepID=A0ABY8N4U6_9FLAO|nr:MULTISPECIES: serine hydrolase [Flavobacterium]WGK94670.1 serine hydrolase [Flavobacterium keumense]
MKYIFTVILALIIHISTCYGQTNKENEANKKIDRYLSALESVGFSGSVLVEINGKKVIAKGYGFCDAETQITNSPKTIFDIGSITKQFTAAAILKLEMQGKLSTNDKISKFFDKIPSDKQQITIHDLLRHQSGLISNVGRDFEKISEKEFLENVFNSELLFPVGTNFSYSNIGYSLLAMIIEKTSNKSYETYLYENLWKPSQMKMTGYTRPSYDKNYIAVGYENDNKVWGKPTEKEWDTVSPYWHLKGNGGILSTTEDLYKWHKCLLSEKILSNDAKQKLYHPKLRPEETENSYYAYGWDVSKTNRNTTQVWHNGTNRIFYADFLRFIDEKVTFIMLSNKSHPNFNNLNFEMARIVFNPNFIPEIPIADNAENRNFSNNIIKTISEFGIEKAKEEYAKKKSTEQLLEFLMREEGFKHIDNGKPEIAVQIFEMNVFVYPKSAKALQGLGEGYMETGKNELALKYLKESLAINPDNPFVSRLIKQLDK